MTADELRELQERAFQVEGLTKTPGWDYLTDFVKSILAPKQRQILAGTVGSLEDYRELCGWIKGVTFVLTANDELQAQVQRAVERGEGEEDA